MWSADTNLSLRFHNFFEKFDSACVISFKKETSMPFSYDITGTQKKATHKGASIYDVRKIFGILDPPLSAFGTDLQY